MFRKMRRNRQELSEAESCAVLERGTAGVLAVSGDDGYPYAVPLSYVYYNSKIYFHVAKSGHKLDAVMKNDKVSFCVIDKNQIVPEKYTTYFRSVIAFGRVRILPDEEKREALEALAAKYSPEQTEDRKKEVDRQLQNVCMLELTIEHLSGKEAKELVREKEKLQ